MIELSIGTFHASLPSTGSREIAAVAFFLIRQYGVMLTTNMRSKLKTKLLAVDITSTKK